MKTSSIRRAATVATLVAGISMGAAGSAQAVVRDVDPFKIAVWLGKADFGRGNHLWGSPERNGVLIWDESTNGRNVTATLSGRVYWDDVTSGGCARIRMRLYTTSGTLAGTAYSAAACRSGGWTGTVPHRAVNLSLNSLTAHKVVVTAQKAPGGSGPWTNEESVTRYLGQLNGVID
jgi:hypothetical protein